MLVAKHPFEILKTTVQIIAMEVEMEEEGA
jgi:hypothetical protein